MNKLLSKIRRQRKGFSLPEVMVGVAVLATVIVASTSLLVTTMRTNNNNAKRLIAMNLAAEGIEAIRNVRDSNWLQGINWRSDTDEGRGLWGTDLKAGEYAVSLKAIEKMRAFSEIRGAKADTVSGLKEYVPWQIRKIDSNSCPKFDDGSANLSGCALTKIYRHQNSDIGVFYNLDSEALNAETSDSGFRRWVEISDLPKENDDLAELRMRVKGVVTWEDQGGEQRVELETELTDWKEGPL